MRIPLFVYNFIPDHYNDDPIPEISQNHSIYLLKHIPLSLFPEDVLGQAKTLLYLLYLTDQKYVFLYNKHIHLLDFSISNLENSSTLGTLQKTFKTLTDLSKNPDITPILTQKEKICLDAIILLTKTAYETETYGLHTVVKSLSENQNNKSPS